MTEGVKVLEHHKQMVEKNWIGVTDLSEAKECIKRFVLDECDGDLADGFPMYPKMNREEFINNFARIIIAVNEGNAEEIPDWKEKGMIFNSDAVCNSCGNLVPQEKIQKRIEDGGTNCELHNRVKILSARLH